MSGRRGLVVALAGCALAGALVLVCAGRVWGSATVTATAGAQQHLTATGHAAEPALPALGFALLVSTGALIASRRLLRRLVGLVVVVIGGAAIGLAATSHDDVVRALTRHAFAVQTADVHVSLSAWAVLTAVGGAIGVVIGAAAVLFGNTWPALGARYETPVAKPKADTETATWDALDRGEDPTRT